MKIIAFVDGSNYSQSVCDYAAWAAQGLPADVELFHILGRRSRTAEPADLSGNLRFGERTDLLDQLSKADEQWMQLAQARGRAVLDDAVARITQKTDQSVTMRLRHDDFVDSLIDYEKDAEMVIVGKRGEASGFAREHLGSNLERALRSAVKPVLVASFEYKPIDTCLIAYDGGKSIGKSLDFICASPLFKGVKFHLLQVSRGDAAAEAKVQAAKSRLKGADIDAEVIIRDGHAEHVIHDVSLEIGANLLIMGAYGHSRVRNFIIGSTTTAVVRACRMPLLMFR